MTSVARQVLTEFLAALRSLTRRPLAAALPVLILTLGFTGVSSVYSMIKSTQIDPLPFDRPHTLAYVGYADTLDQRESQPLYPADIRALLKERHPVEAVGAFRTGTITLTEGDRGERFEGAFVTPGLFRLLGVAPMLGRDFTAEDVAAESGAIILSHAVWTRRYDADPGILGRTVRTNQVEAVVVGVMPPDFGFPFNEAVWRPLDLERAEAYSEERRAVSVIRIAQDSSVAQLAGLLHGRFAEWSREAPETHRSLRLVVQPLDRFFVDWQFRGFVNLLFGALAALALIACANAAGVILADNSSRGREVSVHFAMGATPRRIGASVMTRCISLVCLALAASIPLMRIVLDWSLIGLRAGEDPVPYWLRFRMDEGVFGFLGLAGLAALIAVGGLPAIVTSRIARSSGLRSGTRVGPGPVALKLLNGLLAAQVGLAVVAVTTGMICALAFSAMVHMDVGAATASVMTGRLALPEDRYEDPLDRLAFLANVRTRLQSVPGVLDVALTTDLPGFSGSPTRVLAGADGRQWTRIRASAVDDGFFRTLGIEVQSGRPIDLRDIASTERVVVVDEELAKRIAYGGVAVGRSLPIDLGESEPVAHRVIGVVPRLHLAQVDDPREPAALLALAQRPPRFVTAAIRVSGDPASFATALAQSIRAADPEIVPYWVRSLDEAITHGRGTVRFLASWFVGVGVLSLILTAFGIFGVAQIRATVQSREIGIRRALGGGAVRILVPLARPIVASACAGLGVGSLAAVLMGRAAAKLAPGVVTADLNTASLVLAAILTAGLVAGSWPAMRALRISPCEALRSE